MSTYSGTAHTSSRERPNGPDQPWHRWQDFMSLAFGVLLFIAPWLWRNTAAATGLPTAVTGSEASAWGCSVVIVLMALWALSAPAMAFPEWTNALLGAWLFVSPWVFGLGSINSQSAWCLWVGGGIVLLMSVWAWTHTRRAKAKSHSSGGS